MALLDFTKKGIYCAPGDFYIDPWRKVNKAIITHAHADHARQGHRQYIAMKDSVPILKFRLGSFIQITGLLYNESIMINGVKVSFHPAGHIIGSAQVRVEFQGEIWVVSGDYKTVNDGITTPFEPVKCHTFITESTFGMPSFQWSEHNIIHDDINAWWSANAAKNTVSIIAAYSLGKAQRITHNLDLSIGPLYTHGAIENTHNVLRQQGYNLPIGKSISISSKASEFENAMVLAPPSAMNTAWANKFGASSEAVVSGWMAIRSIRKRRNAEYGFVLSDHADWSGLLSAIQSAGAENIFVTHGYTEVFAKYLNEIGYNAAVVKTEFSGDEELTDMTTNETFMI